MIGVKSDSLNDLKKNDANRSSRIGVSFSTSNLSSINKKVNPVKKHAHRNQFITVGKKSTTRHLAALDFLLNISMKNEISIKENGIQNALRQQELAKADQDAASVDSNEDLSKVVKENVELNINPNSQLSDDFMGSPLDAPGKKLSGAIASIVRIPNRFRFHLSRLTEQSAVVRQWEDQLLLLGTNLPPLQPQPILSSRMFFSRAKAYPIVVFSVIKYDAGTEKAKLEKQKADDKKGMEIFKTPQRDWRGSSYKLLFKLMSEELKDDYFYQSGYMFDPNSLDDPDLLHGSYKYVLKKASNTGPIVSSIILFANVDELKEDLNDQFREKHPHLPPSLTISKIRNLKKSALIISYKMNFEISTVALAVISFERLCLKSLVTKSNRCLTMAVALVLAYKFNEPITSTYHEKLDELLDQIDEKWEVSRKDLFEAEFGVYVQLGFSLHVPHQHIYLIYNRLLKLIHKTSRNYLGDEMSEMYNQTIIKLERAKDFEIERIKIERIQAEERERELKEKELKYNQEKLKLIPEYIINQEKKKKSSKLSIINPNNNNSSSSNNNVSSSSNNNGIDNNLISNSPKSKTDDKKINILTQAKQSFKETLKEFKEIRKSSILKEGKDKIIDATMISSEIKTVDNSSIHIIDEDIY